MSFTSCGSIRWAFNIKDWKPTREQWKLVVQCVQREEKERCNRFAFVEDCKSSMAGQLLMRKAASEMLGLPYNSLEIGRFDSGKPFVVKEEESFFFNISHNGDFCILAAEKDFIVGADVMKVQYRCHKETSDFFTLMKKQFSYNEWEFISLPGTEKMQLERFYRLWCLKESYVKAMGTGIVYDLKSLSFSCSSPIQQNEVTNNTQLFIKEKLQSEWKFEETYLDSQHCAAVALRPFSQGPTCQKSAIVYKPSYFKLLTFDDVVQNAVPFEQLDENYWQIFQKKREKFVQ